jgi:hypothetical protein
MGVKKLIGISWLRKNLVLLEPERVQAVRLVK